MKDLGEDITGHLLALITILIWGTTFVSTKMLLDYFSPVEILFMRFVIGFAVLVVICPHLLKVRDKKHEMYFAAAGLCGVTLYYLLENMALSYTLASNVGVIISIAPFITAIFAHFFIKNEKFRIQFFIGFIIAVAGISLISFNGSNVLELNPLGDLLTVLAAIAWAAYSILTKKIAEFHYNMILATRRIFLYGLIFMIPELLVFGFAPDVNALMQPTNLFNILFLGIGASAICFLTWNSAVKMLGVVKTSVYIYLGPVITVITSLLVLHENITIVAIIGMILTLAGLIISRNGIIRKKKDVVDDVP
ncbi:MAG: DMT family transporter [Candidatus Methanogranum gryphiswaldense]|nr:MAG: DMT family transporter [Candidatus Methanogranum sp. U3.2.1]